ncbi:unnamed protein product [Cylindrotheca closterium]|uniref:Uncharacterized protein n=1 Tax=Cylindrotheca closterium TaxID=2856 RepID=A0AAD2JJF5_9STRA|nr:unnamed protein product [Cylindrotheca closterium]
MNITTTDERESTQVESTWSLDAMGNFAVEDRSKNPFFARHHNSGEDDAWVSLLLPLPSTLSSSPSLPLKISRNKDISLYAHDNYKQAYQNISILSTEQLSNEEWTARRFQREQNARFPGQISTEQNLPVQQYYRSDQSGIEGSLSATRNFSVEQELLLSQRRPEPTQSPTREEYPRARPHRLPISTIFHRESLIDRSRTAVSSMTRFLVGSFLSINNLEPASRSEATTSPAWVGRDGIEDYNGTDRAGLDSMAGIGVRRSRQSEIQAFYGDDDSDDDTAYWTTGTAMETIYDSDSSNDAETEELESAPAAEERHQIENDAAWSSGGDEFLEWNYCTEAQQGVKIEPTFPHDPFVQFNSRRL